MTPQDEGEQDEGEGIMNRMKGFFHDEDYELESETGYSRRMGDRGIERYLDYHFDEYIDEFDVVTGLDLEYLEQRYTNIRVDTQMLRQFTLDADALIADLERRVVSVKGKAT